MRGSVDAEAVRSLARTLAKAAKEPTTLYLTGGSTAVMEGWRPSTVDADIRLEPESDELLRAIPAAKEALGINIEFASPPDFVPELSGWRERSPFVLQEGPITVRHFDPYSQALSKIERGFEQDLADVASMVERGLIERTRALELFTGVESELVRYPAIDPTALAEKVQRALS